MAPAFSLPYQHIVSVNHSLKITITASMLLEYWKAEMFYTTISNLRKDLAEVDSKSWQVLTTFLLITDIPTL